MDVRIAGAVRVGRGAEAGLAGNGEAHRKIMGDIVVVIGNILGVLATMRVRARQNAPRISAPPETPRNRGVRVGTMSNSADPVLAVSVVRTIKFRSKFALNAVQLSDCVT